MWLLDSSCYNHITSSPDVVPSHTSTSLPPIYTANFSPMHVSQMIMPKNIKPMNLPLFYTNLVLFLISLVQALLSKMAELSANFVIFLTLFVLLQLLLLLLLSFWGKLLLLSFTPSIGVLLPLFRIKLLMKCCLVLLPLTAYLKSLDVSVLFFFMIMKETNFSLILVYFVFLGMELVKKVIGVMIPLANIFVFLGMWSFGNKKCFTNYLMFLFPLFPLSILSLTFFLRSLPHLCLSLPLLLLMFILIHLMSFPHRSSTCPLILPQLWILLVLLILMHFVVPIG